MTIGEQVARDYATGKLLGWMEAREPGIAREQFNLLKDSFRPFYISGQTQPYSGKKAFLHQLCRKVLGKDTPLYPQEIGDCFVAGTLVQMADGSEKAIENVAAGELVVTHKGNIRPVLRTIDKSYTGRLLTVGGKGHPDRVTATPDHRFVTVPFEHHRYQHDDTEWRSIDSIEVSDRVLIPFGLDQEASPESLTVYSEPRSHKPPRQMICCDESFSRLLGLYLAEGGISANEYGPYRLEFSLSSQETKLADEIISLIRDVFAVEAQKVSLLSKPSVLLVRCGNTDVATFFETLVPGNVYDKRVPAVFFRSSRRVRRALLDGWLDGDGSRKQPGKVVGVSCSRELLRDMHRLCRSCGLRPMFNQRKKAAHQTVASGQVCLYGEAHPERTRRRMKDIGPLGRAVAVKTIEESWVSDIHVYCLEVEGDHSFIANGYAAHNCVSFGAKNGTEYLSCSQILGAALAQRDVSVGDFIQNARIKWKPVFPPYYYGTGRVYVGGGRLGNSDGSLGSWMAEAVMKYGTIFSDETGVPAYSGRVAKAWGDPNPSPDLDKFKATGQKYLVRSAAQIRSWDELVAAIANGYSCPTASNVGYDMEPSSDGFHRQRGSWAHQMCFIGVDETHSEPYALILNNWGDVHGHLRDFQTSEDLPLGVLRVRRSDAEKHIRAQETFAWSQFDGFPEQDLERFLFMLI